MPLCSAISAAKNQLNPSNGVVDDWNFVVWPFLADANDWFVLYEDYDLRGFWKWKPTLEKDGDFGTGNLVYKATARYNFFSNRYERMWGASVT